MECVLGVAYNFIGHIKNKTDFLRSQAVT